MANVEKIFTALSESRVLITLGRPVVDVWMRVPHIPGAGEKVLTSSVVRTPGGVDGNYAASLARLGAQVTVIGSKGSDDLAQLEEDDLAAAGVEARWDLISAGSSTVCYVTVDNAGERAVVVDYPHDEDAIAAGLLREAKRGAQSSWDLVYLGVLRAWHGPVMKVLQNSTAGFAATLEESDWPEGDVYEALKRLQIVFVAEETYLKYASKIHELQREHGLNVVITLGAEGSKLLDSDGQEHIAGTELIPEPIVDTTGAGDAFASAFSALWLGGMRGSELLRAANWYAGRKITQVGPRSFAPRAELMKFIEAL